MNTQTINQSTQPAVLINPFPGLRPFEFDESHLFFGRDGQSERLIAKLAATRFLAVVGTSGSGKSSLVRAGLLPALYSGFMPSAGSAWRIAIMRPGNDPLGNLARALNAPEVFGSDDEANRALQVAITEATLRRGSLGLVEAAREQQLPASENLLVVADQFEELFRVEQGTKDAEHENDRAAFVKLLLAATAKPQGQDAQREVNIYVVLTMRSDYLGDCAQFWDLPEAINDGQYLIPRLTREQIREAITGPIFVGGAEATPRLINRLLNDVGDNPDQLPILQHALMRTWDHWQEYGFVVPPSGGSDAKADSDRLKAGLQTRTPIDLEHYEAIGGMAQALSLHADETLDMVGDDRHRLVAERVFKALTEKGPDNREIRRPVVLKKLRRIANASEAEVKQVIETFRAPGRSFLMPPAGTELKPESLIDISHESLMRNWERLNAWVEDEARSVRIYKRLAETTELFQKNEANLLRDPELQVALDWRIAARPNPHWAERYSKGYKAAIALLNMSAARRKADLAAAELQRRKDIENADKQLMAAIAVAEAQQQRAEAEKRRAEDHARASVKIRRRAWIAGGLAVLACLAAWLAFTWYRSAEIERVKADEQRQRAQISENIAVREKAKADIARDDAEKAANDAKEQKKQADDHRKNAEDQAKKAKQFKDEAEREKRRANEGEQRTANNLELLAEVIDPDKVTPAVRQILTRVNLGKTNKQISDPKSNTEPVGSNTSLNRARPRIPKQFGLNLWENGATLRVKFLNGNVEQQQSVLRIAQEWSNYANLHFEISSSPNAEIRITLAPGGGVWSFLGAEALSVSMNEPTMSLGWRDEGSVLHEFGHVLGLIHENQNPNANLPWNRDAVIRELTRPPSSWDIPTIEHNIFAKEKNIEYRLFDPDSIMMYAYSASWFTDGISRGGKKVLSESDKQFARKLYPPR